MIPAMAPVPKGGLGVGGPASCLVVHTDPPEGGPNTL